MGGGFLAKDVGTWTPSCKF
uniref:Uncharacterized protein n=1 Tax=Arundo donax TaxID=35708 RepID=A0A0A9A0D3_ARUDO